MDMTEKLKIPEEILNDLGRLAMLRGEIEDAPWNLCAGTMLAIRIALGVPPMEA
jgi:hypothetical protein